MEIKVKLWGQLKQVSGTADIQLKIQDGSNISDAVRKIADSVPELKPFLIDESGVPKNSTLTFINSKQIPWDQVAELKDGEELMLMTPIAGG